MTTHECLLWTVTSSLRLRAELTLVNIDHFGNLPNRMTLEASKRMGKLRSQIKGSR
jgi:hypothetical protein